MLAHMTNTRWRLPLVALLLCALSACAPSVGSTDGDEGASASLSGHGPGALFRSFLEMNGGVLAFQDDLFERVTRSGRVSLDLRAGAPGQDFAATVVPFGRSLERESTTLQQPRILVAYSLRPPGVSWRNTLFMAYTPAMSQLEIIAPNERGDGNGGYADFLLVTNYARGQTPQIIAPAPGVCSACHLADAPILPPAPWSEFRDDAYVVGEGRARKLREDIDVVAPVRMVLTKLARGVERSAYDEAVRNDALALFGLPVVGKIPDRVVDENEPRRFGAEVDPLLQFDKILSGTFSSGRAPEVRAEAVATRDAPQPDFIDCQTWKKLEPHADAANRAERIFHDRCGNCHEQRTLTAPVPSCSWTSVQEGLCLGSANEMRNPLSLIESCAMPPRRAEALDPQERADLVAYLRALNTYPSYPAASR